QGFLTGKYKPGTVFTRDDRRRRLPHFSQQKLCQNMWVIDRLQAIAQLREKSITQVAIRWVLDNPCITGAITGIKSLEQIEGNAGALGWQLSHEERRYLESEWSRDFS